MAALVLNPTPTGHKGFLYLIGVSLALCFPVSAFAQPTALGSLSSHSPTLRIVAFSAHPDDEDGATLTRYAFRADTAVFSVFFTRGEGGQNERGSEQGDELALIRTAETYRAASILGAETFFFGFPDFGYSKHAEETFIKWGGKAAVVSRVVHAIRLLQPDVIITNHDTITQAPYRQHGHHQAVGISLYEAFKLAGDSSYAPWQLKQGVRPWQPQAIYTRYRPLGVTTPTLQMREVPIHDSVLLNETARQRAFRALAEHRSQGMDKIDSVSFPFLFRPIHYSRTSSSLNSPSTADNEPSSGRMLFLSDIYSRVHDQYSPELLLSRDAPFSVLPAISLFPSSPVIYLPHIQTDSVRGAVTFQRTISISLSNETGEILPVMLSLFHGSRFGRVRLLTKHYVFSGSQRFRIRDSLSFSVTSFPPFFNDYFEFYLRPISQADTGRIPSFYQRVRVQSPEFTLPRIRRLGLIETYDYTLRETLTHLGIPFTLLDSTRFQETDLRRFSTILVDMRVHGYRKDVVRQRERLFDYMKRGGHLVLFYNKPFDVDSASALFPFPLQLTAQRVTDETAAVQIRFPKHRVLTSPNPILPSDWEGWVQERSVYLPSDDTLFTSAKYRRLLSMKDWSEDTPSTALIETAYGKGRFTYVSLALHRQLRIWQSGAIKLFLNLIAD